MTRPSTGDLRSTELSFPDSGLNRGTKQKRKLSKDDHIYGIFREDLPEREDEVKRRTKPFSEPLSFVSSGKVGPVANFVN